jgi:membrane protein DedA with SNARE-associated domain
VIPVLGRVSGFLVAAVALHVRHRHGASVDYWGVGVAALASWVGLPGPGEATLITAGILAAHHRVDIGLAIVAAFIGANVGGVAGWAAGLKAGSAVFTGPGPFRRGRVWALARGERIFRRFGVVAVFLTPSWVAGILRIRGSFFIPANTGSAAVWALGWGLGGFFVGPTIADIATDFGYVGAGAVCLLVISVAVAAFMRRRRRPAREGN